MSHAEWKERLARLPVLGNLLAGARGVWSLPVWRAQLRAQIAALAERAAAGERRLDALETRQGEPVSSDAVQLQLGVLRQRQERAARQMLEQARRLESMDSTLRAALMQWRQQRAGEVAGERAVPAAGAPASMPLDALLAEPQLGVPHEVRAALQEQANIQPGPAVWLPHATPEGWAAALRVLAPGSLAVVLADRGAGLLDRAGLDALLDAAGGVLRPHGLLVLGYANPEQADVAARLVASAAGAPVWTPGLVEQRAVAAGYAGIQMLRHEQDDAVQLPGEGEAIARLNRWLCGPRRFVLCAQRAL